MSRHCNIIFYLSAMAFVLALFVVVLGAYVRLSDAGLGCPDWPGCYGKILVPENIDVYLSTRSADELLNIRALEVDKAWKEMIHRYAAGALGILILSLALTSFWHGKEAWIKIISGALLLLVIGQALLGMWTVTLLLKPIVVVLHLIGGMSILALLFILSLRLWQRMVGILLHPGHVQLLPWIGFSIATLVAQIALGGWTSANYAALACPDFPVCQGQWWPNMNFLEGFTLWRQIGVDYEGGVLSTAGRTAIHVMHRIGALLSCIVILCMCYKVYALSERTSLYISATIAFLLCMQIALGISNVLLSLPLSVALLHQATAMLLLLSIVFLLHYSLPIRMPRLGAYVRSS